MKLFERELRLQCSTFCRQLLHAENSHRPVGTREFRTLAAGMHFKSSLDVQCDAGIGTAVCALEQIEPPRRGRFGRNLRSKRRFFHVRYLCTALHCARGVRVSGHGLRFGVRRISRVLCSEYAWCSNDQGERRRYFTTPFAARKSHKHCILPGRYTFLGRHTAVE